MVNKKRKVGKRQRLITSKIQEKNGVAFISC